MFNKRQQTILKYITEQGDASASELRDLAGDVSTMTLWRDLSLLEKEGLIIRYRGGATAARQEKQNQEINFVKRARLHTDEKTEIALLAADLIDPSQSYYIDAGTTTSTLLSHLHDGAFNFVTSAANIAAELALRKRCDITLLGGQLNSNTLSCSGPQTEEMLSELNIDIAVMAASGYTHDSGFTSGRLAEATLKKKVIKKAALTIMLLDHSKLSCRHPFTFADLTDIDILIGDRDLPESFLAHCAEEGTRVFSPADGLSTDERRSILRGLLHERALP